MVSIKVSDFFHDMMIFADLAACARKLLDFDPTLPGRPRRARPSNRCAPLWASMDIYTSVVITGLNNG